MSKKTKKNPGTGLLMNVENILSEPDGKLFLADVVFKTPVMGQGIIRAKDEADATAKLCEVYKDAEDLHVISLKPTTEDEAAAMIDAEFTKEFGVEGEESMDEPKTVH